ncbi:MAG: DUF2203 family protein [Candidatus Omnitrophica bacterium]|nr:DUF2203 family protein [Candidatus Omnitrophota bacterium]
MKPLKKKRVFSREEADTLLPELEKRLKLLRTKKEAYSRTHDLLFMHELVCAAERTHGLLEEKDDLEDGIHALEEAIEELAKDVEAIFAMGCMLRNIEKGHVEFFGIHEDREIYFSWQLGEPCVSHYRLPGKKIHERVPLSGKAAAKKPK